MIKKKKRERESFKISFPKTQTVQPTAKIKLKNIRIGLESQDLQRLMQTYI